MPRDYKNATVKDRTPPRSGFSWISFGSGLCVGLFVAFLVFLEKLPLPASTPGWAPAEDATAVVSPESVEKPTVAVDTPKRKFDFYTILPEFEIKVPEWTVGNRDSARNETATGSYVLQVGSFQHYAEADQVKARLALQGISANIHRVVINGQDVWYRVLVGPFTESQELQLMRQRLSENGMKYMMAKVKVEKST